MKSKILYSLVAIVTFVLTSCDPSGLDTSKKEDSTTYTIAYNIDNRALLQEYISLGATITESIVISEYNDKNERVNIQDMENIKYGSKKTFTSHSLAEKIAVYIELEVSYNGKSEEMSRWVAQVYYLEKGSNITIAIDGETRVSSACPVK